MRSNNFGPTIIGILSIWAFLAISITPIQSVKAINPNLIVYDGSSLSARAYPKTKKTEDEEPLLQRARLESNVQKLKKLSEEARAMEEAWQRAGLMRRGLETARAKGQIDDDEYWKNDALVGRWEVGIVIVYYTRAWSSEVVTLPNGLPILINPDEPTLIGDTSFSIRWAEMLYERKSLLELRYRKVISEAEYNRRLEDIIERERQLAIQHPLTETEIKSYKRLIAKIESDVVEMERYAESRRSVFGQASPLPMAFATILSAILLLFINYRKDKREKEELVLKVRDMELKERDIKLKTEEHELTKIVTIEEFKELQLKIQSLQLQLAEQQKGPSLIARPPSASV